MAGYNLKKMECQKHGFTTFFEGYKEWQCASCQYDDMVQNIEENIQIIASLNLNEIEQ